MSTVGPAAALRRSWQLFARAPGAGLALGTSLLFSLISVCCGFGLLIAPWFLCELFAHQLGLGLERDVQRSRAWLGAAGVQVVAVAVMSSVAAISLLSIGSDVLAAQPDGLADPFSEQLLSLALLAVGGFLSIAVTVHFQFAPALLLDRGGTLLDALLVSARMVAAAGVGRQWAIAVSAHALQVAPAVLIVGALARRASLQSAPWIALGLTPVMALGLTLGQGMITGSYLLVRPEQPPPVLGARRMPTTAAAWSVLMVVLALGPCLVVASLVRPAPLAAGVPAVEPALLQLEVGRDGAVRTLPVPDTALTLRVSPERVALVAGDGGGAGRLPLPEGARIRRVRLVRRGELLHGQIETDRGSFMVRFDEAGVRMDDTLARRLAASLPLGSALALGLSLMWAAAWVPRQVPVQAAALEALALDREPTPEQRRDLRSRGLWAAVSLAPAAGVSLGVGLLAWFG